MDLFYHEVRNFMKNEIKIPKEFKEIIPNEIEDEFKETIGESIEDADIILIDLDKYSKVTENIPDINYLKENKFPLVNFFVEVMGEDNKLGIHVVESNNTIEIVSYIKSEGQELIPFMITVDKEMLPRFYIGCPNKCDKYIGTQRFNSLLNNRLCMRTPRTVKICPIGDALELTIDIMLLALNELNKRPERVSREHTPLPRPHSTRKGCSKHSKQRIIYLNKVSTIGSRSGKSEKGSPKAPHTRRGHYRYYKNGKVVWIDPIKVKGGKDNQKIYKL